MRKLLKLDSILYVEDEKDLQDALIKILKVYCDDLYIANDGQEGLNLFNKHKPSLVISDIKMPNMDGIEMAKKIKEKSSDTHLIFTTAFKDISFLQDAISLQVDGYVLKPIDTRILVDKIVSISSNLRNKKELFEKEQMLIYQNKLASMGELVSNIAHQWKQPLTIISLEASNLLLQKSKEKIDEELLEQSADEIKKQVNLLSDTIEDFRTFYRSDSKYSHIDLAVIIKKCLHILEVSFNEKRIEVIEDIDEELFTFCEPDQLLQAILNILQNIIEAFAGFDKNKKAFFIISAKKVDNEIIIDIKDNAGGIEENIIDKVFEPYFTTKYKSSGTGLGLYITHTIITKNLDGFISLKNEEFEYQCKIYKGAKYKIRLAFFQKQKTSPILGL